MLRKLSDKENYDFDYIRDSDNAVCLMTVEYNGQETAAICAVNMNDDEYFVIPLAILLTEEMKATMKDPEGNLIGD